jgi:acyl dehydratase
MLYALGLGVGSENPRDEAALRFVYERNLVCLPTMAVVLGSFGFWLQDPQYGVDWKRILHGEQSVELHRQLPVEGELRSVLEIDEIYDKGPEKGAVLYSTRRLYEAASGVHLATLRQSSFLRGDGGFGGRRDGAPRPHPVPTDREPDHVFESRTRIDQALIYRLSGDYNPLHVHPAVAAAAGFDRPILHGLCSYGIVGLAVLRTLCAGRADSLRRLDVRFSGVVYPGETLRTDIWRESAGKAALRATVVERGVAAVDNGYVEYEAEPGLVSGRDTDG